MLGFEAVAEARGGELARGIARKAERKRDLRAEKRIAEGVEHQRQGALGYLSFVVTDGELRDQAVDRVEDRVEGVAVARKDHPCGKRSGALAPESVEALVDDHPRVGFAGAGALDRFGDAAVDGVRNRLGKRSLEPGGGAEMMEEVGVSAADLGGDGFERHRLRALIDQQLARGAQRGGPAFFRAEARSSY